MVVTVVAQLLSRRTWPSPDQSPSEVASAIAHRSRSQPTDLADRRRVARHLAEHQPAAHLPLWAAVESIAPKIGCVPQTLLDWVKREEIDTGAREGVTTADAQRMKELERENKELRRANEILKLASAFFAQAELDRRLKS
jgi:transposase-like protein